MTEVSRNLRNSFVGKYLDFETWSLIFPMEKLYSRFSNIQRKFKCCELHLTKFWAKSENLFGTHPPPSTTFHNPPSVRQNKQATRLEPRGWIEDGWILESKINCKVTAKSENILCSPHNPYICNTTAQPGLPSQTACSFVHRLMPCRRKNLGKRRRLVCAVFSWDNHCTKHLKHWTYFWKGKLRACNRSCLRFFSRFCMIRLRARCLVFIGQLENEDIILLLKYNVDCSLYLEKILVERHGPVYLVVDWRSRVWSKIVGVIPTKKNQFYKTRRVPLCFLSMSKQAQNTQSSLPLPLPRPRPHSRPRPPSFSSLLSNSLPLHLPSSLATSVTPSLPTSSSSRRFALPRSWKSYCYL